MSAGIVGLALGGIAGFIIGLIVGLVVDDPMDVDISNAERMANGIAYLQQRLASAEGELVSIKGRNDDLIRSCAELRWMIDAFPDRCIRCDEACPLEETGLCVIDERLKSLGVELPSGSNGLVSQRVDEDAIEVRPL